MRAGDGVGRRTVRRDDGGVVLRIRGDGVGVIGERAVGRGPGRNIRTVDAYREAASGPQNELLRNVAGIGVNVDDCAGRTVPADGNGFTFADTDFLIGRRCRDAHAEHGYEHHSNQKQRKHFFGRFHDFILLL